MVWQQVKNSWVMWCHRSLRPDVCVMTSKSPPSRFGIMQTEGRVRSTLIFWPVTFQISGSDKKAQSEQTNSSSGHKKHKLCTPCKGMRGIPIYKCITIISRPPQEHPHNQLPCLKASLVNSRVAFNRTNPKSVWSLDLFDIQVKPRDRPRVDRKPPSDCWYKINKIIWGIPQGKFYKINLNNELPELKRFHVSFVLFKKICFCFLLFIAAEDLPNLDTPWDFVLPAASSDHSVLWPRCACKMSFEGQESESQLINRWPSTSNYVNNATKSVPLEG